MQRNAETNVSQLKMDLESRSVKVRVVFIAKTQKSTQQKIIKHTESVKVADMIHTDNALQCIDSEPIMRLAFPLQICPK